MKLRKPKTLGAYIPTVSMADIAFLLIIFFMLTTTIPVDRTPVQLPKSIERSGFPEGSAVIAITPEGLINVSDGKEQSHPVADISDIFSFAANVLVDDPTHTFVIKADGQVPYQIIDAVITQLRSARVEKIVLLTDQETVS
ncbi:MAG: biopolymer transporter ExbD [Acidobacteria bacterium]|nr:biopolymer transporter ExbD [Acidobacteriota bacterium]